MTNSLTDTKPEDTICYKCSDATYDRCISMFDACSRHKKKTGVVLTVITLFICCTSVHIYVFANIEADIEGRKDAMGLALLSMYFLYIAINILAKYIEGVLLEAYYEDHPIRDNFFDNSLQKIIKMFPIWFLSKSFFSARPEDSDESLEYSILHTVVFNYSIFTLSIVILYLCDVTFKWWWVSLGLISMLYWVLTLVYYILVGLLVPICWVFYKVTVECCIKPICGYKNLKNRRTNGGKDDA